MPLIRKTPDSVPSLSGADVVARLASSSADARWAAVRDLAIQPESVRLLAKALTGESDARVREAIFTALAKIGSTESITTLVGAVRSDESNLRTGAMDALRTIPIQLEASMPQLLSDSDSDVRLLACDLAREISGETARSLLCALIEQDPLPNVCAAAIEVLAEAGDAETLPSLARCATRFPDDSFLLFAIEAASERLNANRG